MKELQIVKEYNNCIKSWGIFGGNETLYSYTQENKRMRKLHTIKTYCYEFRV